MIISKILGGLGNQMFQYAAGRALSLTTGQPLLLDIRGFDDYQLHNAFELARIFRCPISLATEEDIRHVIRWQSSKWVQRVLKRPGMSFLRLDEYVIEPHYHYWPGVRNVPSNCYLEGYWQSENYFSDQASTIRADFSFSHSLDQENQEIADKVGEVNAVSVHIRRGDYANDAATNRTHGLCSKKYYHLAFQYIAERIDEPFFFFFSDDTDWAKMNLDMPFPYQFIDHNLGAESYNDMRLMSLCNHHIIANSSFSWWGAWLNSRSDKTVIAPTPWFSDEQKDTCDLYPIDWTLLPK